MPKIILIVLLMLLILGVSIFFLIKFLMANKKEELSEEEIALQTAQDFTNVRDIKDCFLFTNDGNAFVYLEIMPISMEMMSDAEQRIFTSNITSALSSEKKPFKTLSFPRPVDLSYLIYKYEAMLKVATSDIEKQLLLSEIKKMKNLSMNNEASEFKFYFVFWDIKENTTQLLKRANDFIRNFESSSISINIIGEKEIARLCNMMNNPSYLNFDDNNYKRTLPQLQ
ncbi:hypothetical protein FL857_03475 [Criibacterium bergeronii]|uniref:Uncharacterized protein n=1 Tax=Criibacterium bergeronii TaxID=1871336 RepID=A0A552VC56_9FIRM|nr:hypothetical protein [Criibacterium bergeronii]TRW28065.1 hypothetical protein FL857_03475 [Criibacterium bergeronii]